MPGQSCQGIFVKPVRPAKQQQTNMKTGISCADSRIVQKHGEGFWQGTDRDGAAAMLRPDQRQYFRHMVTGCQTLDETLRRTETLAVSACVSCR